MEEKEAMDWQEIEQKYLWEVAQDVRFSNLSGGVCLQIAEWCVEAAKQGYMKGKRTE